MFEWIGGNYARHEAWRGMDTTSLAWFIVGKSTGIMSILGNNMLSMGISLQNMALYGTVPPF